jgi:hypothetical protein
LLIHRYYGGYERKSDIVPSLKQTVKPYQGAGIRNQGSGDRNQRAGAIVFSTLKAPRRRTRGSDQSAFWTPLSLFWPLSPIFWKGRKAQNPAMTRLSGRVDPPCHR